MERITEKVKDKKKWQPGVPALPPGRPSKNDCSNSFGEPRNLRPSAGDGTPANIPPKEADQEQAVSRPERFEGLTYWTPWIVGACLTAGALLFLRNAQTRSPASLAAGPVDSAVVSGLAMRYARLGKMAMGVAPRSLTSHPVTSV